MWWMIVWYVVALLVDLCKPNGGDVVTLLVGLWKLLYVGENVVNLLVGFWKFNGGDVVALLVGLWKLCWRKCGKFVGGFLKV